MTDYSNPIFENKLLLDLTSSTPYGLGSYGLGYVWLPIPLAVILLFFAFFPSILPIPKLFKLRGYENVVIEYNVMKKILLGSIIVLIILIIINYYTINYINALGQNPELLPIREQQNTIAQKYQAELENITGSPVELGKQITSKLREDEQSQKLDEQFHAKLITLDPNLTTYEEVINSSYMTIYMVLLIPISILIKLSLERYRKYFTLYYAKGCFKLISSEKMEIDKARYLFEGLLWYNKFLRKNIKLQLNEIIKIYSKIITDSPLQTNKDVILLSESFENKDELLPLRKITTLYPNIIEQVLSKESLRNRIKESSDLLIPIITVIITVITTFLLPKPA